MAIYVLDTDHISLYGRNQEIILAKVKANNIKLTTTAINVEEQLRGRLAQISEAKDGSALSNAYQRFVETVLMLSEFNILYYSKESHQLYEAFKAQKIRVGTQDLRIACITLVQNGILLTRNIRDFEKIPGLMIQDWSK